VYPWGGTRPPPEGAGNYAGEESRQGAPASWNVSNGYRDSFPRTAPVEATLTNALGLHGLGGNVWEWCMDRFNQSTNWRVLRGGSWATSRPEEMLSSYRRGYDPLFRMDDVGFRDQTFQSLMKWLAGAFLGIGLIGNLAAVVVVPRQRQ
jgi:formylglycine-generating enzyme required for sulfatase activity